MLSLSSNSRDLTLRQCSNTTPFECLLLLEHRFRRQNKRREIDIFITLPLTYLSNLIWILKNARGSRIISNTSRLCNTVHGWGGFFFFFSFCRCYHQFVLSFCSRIINQWRFPFFTFCLTISLYCFLNGKEQRLDLVLTNSSRPIMHDNFKFSTQLRDRQKWNFD